MILAYGLITHLIFGRFMEKASSSEERTKFLQNSANLATTLAFWTTAFSFTTGYLIVWKYLSNNGELWIFPRIISDYPFQLFMFGFVFVFLTSLMPFLLGVFAGGLTDPFGGKQISENHLATSGIIIISLILLFLLYEINSMNIYNFTAIIVIVSILLLFLLYELKDSKSSFYFFNPKSGAIGIRIFFSFISVILFLFTIPASRIFHSALSTEKTLFLILLFISIALFMNFLGVKNRIEYSELFTKENSKKIIDLESNISDTQTSIYFRNKDFISANKNIFDFMKITISIGFVSFLALSNFFDVPRVIIAGTGMGGKYYQLKIHKKSYDFIKSNPKEKSYQKDLDSVKNTKYKYPTLKSCVFIQTKNSFYITQKSNNGKTFCDSTSSSNSVGPLVRLPKNDIISVTPE